MTTDFSRGHATDLVVQRITPQHLRRSVVNATLVRLGLDTKVPHLSLILERRTSRLCCQLPKLMVRVRFPSPRTNFAEYFSISNP